jgi:O-antigen/teichoic acid export membrane protein
MGGHGIARSAMFAVGQIVTSSIVLLVLYRYMLDTVGIERLGVWSVVSAAASACGISGIGFSGSVTKFVAKYRTCGDLSRASHALQTSALTIAVAMAIGLVMAFPLLNWILGRVFSGAFLIEARFLLPYALASFWLTSIGGVFQSGLDGCLRADLRSVLVVVGNLLFLVAVFVLLPNYGLIGLAWGRMIQSSLTILAAWIMLRHLLEGLPLFPFRWTQQLFSEMLGYSVNFQIASMAQMLFDPLTKSLLGKYGGPEMVGYFEMANRLVMQFRALIVSANQVLVPMLAGLYETNPKLVKETYRNNYRLVLFISLPIYTLIIAMSPTIGELWIGHYENIFVLFVTALGIAAFLNTQVSAAYFANQGSGNLRWNTVAQLVMGVLNFMLGVLLGAWYGGVGVVIASAVAFIVGSVVVVIAFHVEYEISLSQLVPGESISLIVAGAVSGIVSSGLYYLLDGKVGSVTHAAICLATLLLIIFPPFWRHPLRQLLFSLIGGGVRGVPVR